MTPTANKLSPKQKSQLRSLAHSLSPVVSVGNAGLTKPVFDEIEIALAHHELIKLKLGGTNKDQRQEMSDTICLKTAATMVQIIGRVLIIYRAAKEPRIKLK